MGREAAKRPRALAPLWARVMLGAGWAIICARASALSSDAVEVLRVALTIAASLALGAIVALGDHRMTRRGVAAYALACLVPSLASYAVPLSPPASGYPPEFGRAIFMQLMGLLCVGGVVGVRSTPGPSGILRLGGAFLRGAAVTVVGSWLVAWCAYALLHPLERIRLGAELVAALGALVITGAVTLALEAVRGTAPTPPPASPPSGPAPAPGPSPRPGS